MSPPSFPISVVNRRFLCPAFLRTDWGYVIRLLFNTTHKAADFAATSSLKLRSSQAYQKQEMENHSSEASELPLNQYSKTHILSTWFPCFSQVDKNGQPAPEAMRDNKSGKAQNPPTRIPNAGEDSESLAKNGSALN